MNDDDFEPEQEQHDYATRQRARDAEYRRSYDNWVKSLAPEERRKLEALGLAEAEVSTTKAGGFRDATDLPICSTQAVELPDNDDPSLAPPPRPEGENVHEVLRRIIGEVIRQDDSRLSLDCLALVTGLSYEGDSMTELAERHGVTRAAVSKRCIDLTQALNLKPSRAMRALDARDSYRNARLQHIRTLEQR